jgi:hypothetical protein
MNIGDDMASKYNKYPGNYFFTPNLKVDKTDQAYFPISTEIFGFPSSVLCAAIRVAGLEVDQVPDLALSFESWF